MSNFFDEKVFEDAIFSMQINCVEDSDLYCFYNVFIKNDINEFSNLVFGVSTKYSLKLIYSYFKDITYDQIFSDDVVYKAIAVFYKIYLLNKMGIDINYLYSSVLRQQWHGKYINCLFYINSSSLSIFKQYYSDERIVKLTEGLSSNAAPKENNTNIFSDTSVMVNNLFVDGYNLENILPKKPKNFGQIHKIIDRFSRKVKIKDFELNQRSFIKDLDGAFCGPFKIVVPHKQSDLFELGEELDFCIGNGYYGGLVRDGKSSIVAIYENNKPKYGIELGRYSIKQAWGKSNCPPDNKDIELLKEYILEKFDFNGEFEYLNGSFIEAYAYDKEKQQICLSISGKKYVYVGVEESVFFDFVDSESKGSYFSNNIKPIYDFLRME